MIFKEQIEYYEYILKSILKYIYKSRLTEIIQNNNETINYSLVNKEWFRLVSKIISKLVNLKNYFNLKNLIQNPLSSKSQIHKIIKCIDSKKYCGFDEYCNECNLPNYVNYFKEIVIDDPIRNTIPLLKFYPKNLRFKDFPLEFLFKSSNYEENGIERIKELKIQNVNDLLRVITIKGVERINFLNNVSNYVETLFFNVLVQFKAKVDPIDIDELLIPGCKTSKSTLSKLKKFKYNIDFTYLLGTLKNNLSMDGAISKHIDKLWKYFINKLSYDLTLYELFFNENIYGSEKNSYSIYGLSKENLLEGFEKIFSSPFTNIKKVTIYGQSCSVCRYFFKGIANNNSITDICIPTNYFLEFIELVLLNNNNKTIRNIVIEHADFSDNNYRNLKGLQLLSDYQIDLYSITFNIKINNIYLYINSIISNNFNIKEFNLKNDNRNNDYLKYKITNYQIIKDNKIINIRNYFLKNIYSQNNK